MVLKKGKSPINKGVKGLQKEKHYIQVIFTAEQVKVKLS